MIIEERESGKSKFGRSSLLANGRGDTNDPGSRASPTHGATPARLLRTTPGNNSVQISIVAAPWSTLERLVVDFAKTAEDYMPGRSTTWRTGTYTVEYSDKKQTGTVTNVIRTCASTPAPRSRVRFSSTATNVIGDLTSYSPSCARAGQDKLSTDIPLRRRDISDIHWLNSACRWSVSGVWGEALRRVAGV